MSAPVKPILGNPSGPIVHDPVTDAETTRAAELAQTRTERAEAKARAREEDA